jgi:hypothetical protein
MELWLVFYGMPTAVHKARGKANREETESDYSEYQW